MKSKTERNFYQGSNKSGIIDQRCYTLDTQQIGHIS